MCNCTDLPAVKRVGLREGLIDVLLTIVADIQVAMVLTMVVDIQVAMVLTMVVDIQAAMVLTMVADIQVAMVVDIQVAMAAMKDIMEDIRACLGQSVDMSDELTVAQSDGLVINAVAGRGRHVK